MATSIIRGELSPWGVFIPDEPRYTNQIDRRIVLSSPQQFINPKNQFWELDGG